MREVGGLGAVLGVAVSGLTPARIGHQGDEKQDGPGREKWPQVLSVFLVIL